MNLDDLEPIYFANEQNLDKSLFYPILHYATSCNCMTGYFTSGAFSELSHSLSYFLSTTDSGLKFIVSPNLDKKDINAIRNAVAADANLIPLLFPEFELSQDSLKTKALEALSYLVVTKKLEIRIALQDEGLFHTKCWLFDTEKGMLAVHGSGNATQSGLSINFEQLTVSRSWLNNEAESIVLKLGDRFSKIWDGHYQGITTLSLNKKTMEFLSKIYQDIKGDSPSDIADKLRECLEKDGAKDRSIQELQVPDWLNYTTGDYAHQGEAIKSWRENNGRGVLSIATGGGKTLTSLVAATLIASSKARFFLVIAVPTVALLEQWAEDVNKFNVKPINTVGLSATKIAQEINNSIRKLKINASKSEVIIITHEALKNERLINLFKKASKNTKLMLIGDEVHNLGSIGFQQTAMDEFVYRLGSIFQLTNESEIA